MFPEILRVYLYIYYIRIITWPKKHVSAAPLTFLGHHTAHVIVVIPSTPRKTNTEYPHIP